MENILNNGFQLLTCDEDVLLFEKHTFTVGRLKELVFAEVRNKAYYSISAHSHNRHYLVIEQLNQTYSAEQKITIPTSESYWVSRSSNIECKLLKISSPGWKNGNLRIGTKVIFFPEEYTNPSYIHHNGEVFKTEIQVNLEFCSDELDEYQSPLDKLRKIESEG